ncbi:MAG TPA: type II toxin-antitoxin system RelE/ParE family toxin [Thermoprotei archaeon]|nr:type II toxin-antitoxin system RelE/ParE family toxin [Thermoprotei archaeon]
MRYKIYLTGKARKKLDSLNQKSRRMILDTLSFLRDYGFSQRLDIKKLKGFKNHYRLRVGKYRILFELEKPDKIIIYAILPRKKAYKK